jgi:hypothetical protein
LRLTAAVATRRIHVAAGKAGGITLSQGLRETMAAIDLNHPALALFLTTAKVTGGPQPIDEMSGACRCRLEGLVKSVNAGARVVVVLYGGKVLVEEVEWA